MATKIKWEELSFGIITKSGMAKSSAMEALYAAKKKDYKTADAKLKEANRDIAEASHLHMDVITEEAQGVNHQFKVLFIHAEDQLLTTQTLMLLIEELIDIYKKIN